MSRKIVSDASDYEGPASIVNAPEPRKSRFDSKHATHFFSGASLLIAVCAVIYSHEQAVSENQQAKIAKSTFDFQTKQYAESRQQLADQRSENARASREHAQELERSLRQGDRSARAAEESARTARLALNLQREQFMQAQRPWLVYDGVTVARPLIVGEKALLISKLSNVGSSIAIGVQTEGVIKIGDPISSSDFDYLTRLPFTGAKAEIGQHIDTEIPNETPVIIQELKDAIAANKKTVSIFGKYRYSDQFGQAHEGRWCSYLIYHQNLNEFGQAACSGNNGTN